MYFLCDRKYQRTGQSCTAFGASFVQELLCNIFQSVHTSPLAACRNAWGGKNSLRSNNLPPTSKHCSAAHCASQRCPFAFSDGLPFAIKIYWNVSRTLTRTIVMSKKHRQCKNHNGNPCCLAAIVWGTSKRSTAIIFLKNCRTQCDPQHPTNSRKDWSGTIAGEQCLRRREL